MRLELPPSPQGASERPANLTDRIYIRLKEDICNFRLLPGDHFSENEIATRMGASRTPVREALTRLYRDGFVEVRFRSGWQVKPFNFSYFEQLYDLRIVLEEAAVKRLCASEETHDFEDLKGLWLVRPDKRSTDGPSVAQLDERFHGTFIEATGNLEMVRVHQDITERLRSLRRLDFTKPKRVEATYDEHAKILKAVLRRRVDEASDLLSEHILTSKSEVREITLHMMHEAHTHR